MLYLANNRLLLINNGNSLYRIDSQTQPEPDSDSFKFTIDTTLGAGDSFDLPLRSGYNYNFIVDWGDGNTSTVTSFDDVNKTHTYATGGEYQISITGLCEAWYFNNVGDRLKLISIDQWGGTGFKNMESAFTGCSNLTSSTDSDGGWCSGVTNMGSMFSTCRTLKTLDVSKWNVSKVTNMSTMFSSCSSLTTLDVSNWDVSKVTNMEGMFQNTPLDTPSYDALLIGWSQLPSVQSNVEFHANLAKYSRGAAADARQYFINRYGWTISDAGHVV